MNYTTSTRAIIVQRCLCLLQRCAECLTSALRRTFASALRALVRPLMRDVRRELSFVCRSVLRFVPSQPKRRRASITARSARGAQGSHIGSFVQRCVPLRFSGTSGFENHAVAARDWGALSQAAPGSERPCRAGISCARRCAVKTSRYTGRSTDIVPVLRSGASFETCA